MNPRASRLLIVDDNKMNRDMLARRLARKGYEVVLADNARQLLRRVKEDAIDSFCSTSKCRRSAAWKP